MTRIKSVYELIQEFEQNSSPELIKTHWKGKEFEVYPWIKPYLFAQIQQGNKPNSKTKSKLFQLRKLFSGATNIFKPTSTVVFSNTLEKRVIKGIEYDKLFQRFFDSELGRSLKVIETIFPTVKKQRGVQKISNSHSRSVFYMLETIYIFLWLRRLKIENDEELMSFMIRYNIDYDVLQSVKQNIAQLAVARLWLRFNKKLKRVLLSVSYTNYGLVLACKERGITVIECQHGVVNNEHYGYSYCYAPRQDQFPDYFLCFGNSDKEFLDKSPLGNYIKGIAVGSFILDHYSGIVEKRRSIDKVNKVAVSLQDCETGVKAVDEFIHLATRNPHVDFYFKRRRLELSYYHENFDFPANVIFEEKMNIYELIVNCDLHLTAYSSCALEAITLGRPNMLFNINNKAKEYYSEKLCHRAFNFFCDSVEEMHDFLPTIQIVNIEDLKASNSGNFKSNYKQNTDLFIEKLLK